MTDGQPAILVEVTGPVAEVVLNRPDRLNALDEPAMDLARDFFQTLASRDDLRAVLIRGAGRAFCAGRDVSGVDPTLDDAHAILADRVHPILRAIRSVPVPVVATVHGACLGVGLGLAAAADIIYAAQNTRIGSPFARLGAVLDSGGHALLVDRLGTHRTMELIVTGELLDGAEAARTGLVSRVLPDDELLGAARALVTSIAAGPTVAFRQSKQIIETLRTQRGLSDSTLAAEATAQGAASATDDYREGFAAFQQRRAPVFAGR
jgi:2-(1,2-epoxy-1,2-dihydrophenyl)acetyl-CoA isomerase